MERSLPTLSLFSNCGAGDSGYARAGFEFGVMAELDERRLHVALLNHERATGVPGDLRETWPEAVSAYRERYGGSAPALLAACPPCQGMSSARGRRGREADASAGSRDHRNLLVDVIADVADALSPRVVVVENVPAFLTRLVKHPRTGEPVSAALLLTDRLDSEYRVFPFLTDLADYAVPQKRVRAFLTFVRRDEPGLGFLDETGEIPYPCPTSPPDSVAGHMTLREALARLAAAPLDAKSAELARDRDDPLHFVPVWGNDHRYRMVSTIPSGSGRGAWDNEVCGTCGEVDVGLDDAVCPLCGGPLSRPVVQEADGTYRLVRGFRTSSYSRMRPDVPAATVTTASGHVGSDLTVHPFENRVLSPRECAYLQTFPDEFDWGDSIERWGPTNVRAMIGEAVPPRFTELHGRVVRGILEGSGSVPLASVDDPRTRRASDRLDRTRQGGSRTARRTRTRVGG